MVSEFHILPDYISSCNLFVQESNTDLISIYNTQQDKCIVTVKVLKSGEKCKLYFIYRASYRLQFCELKKRAYFASRKSV